MLLEILCWFDVLWTWKCNSSVIQFLEGKKVGFLLGYRGFLNCKLKLLFCDLASMCDFACWVVVILV